MGFLYSQLFVTPTYPTTSCKGETIIVTGSNTGLGKEAVRHFARLGATKVILAVRNIAGGEDAKRDIVGTTKCGDDVLEVWPLDLLSYDSCKAFAERAAKLPRIDALVENAGVAGESFSTVGGRERLSSVNVISTFYLALLMLPKLKAVAKEFKIEPRLTIVTSEVHGHTSFPEREQNSIFGAVDDEKNWEGREGEIYPVSKLLGILALREIAPQLQESGVILNTINPGLCHSELSRDAGWVVQFMKFILARSTEVGSRTVVAGAMAGRESHGRYMTDAKVNDEALSAFVRSEEGKEVGKRVWKELKEILEGIHPGVTGNLG